MLKYAILYIYPDLILNFLIFYENENVQIYF